jgi:hypothetical protein
MQIVVPESILRREISHNLERNFAVNNFIPLFCEEDVSHRVMTVDLPFFTTVTE